MIKYIKRKDLDVEKYNACIEKSIQSKIYAFSWYLDVVTENWSVFVYKDYNAVMPIPWKKKFFIKYGYPPFWLLELGVFSLDDKVDFQLFYKTLFDKFKFVETRLNQKNKPSIASKHLMNNQMQILKLDTDYPSILSNYRKDRKKDILKASKNDLTEKWNDDPVKLIDLFKENIGKRTPNILENDYNTVLTLMKLCIDKRVGEVLSIYDAHKNIVASGFFLKHKNEITILMSSTDFKNRNNGANTFLIDRAIFKFEKNFTIFNFGGSTIKSVAKYFLSFGAETLNYQHLKYNNLPFLFKLLKQ